MSSTPPPFPSLSASPPLVEQIDQLLPQTQCGKCGYPACRPYAEAIAAGKASHNQCPPGGAEGVARLARVLDRPLLPLDPIHGIERPRPVALIDESLCIGCTLCIQACPVDAIIGAPRQMHTVWPDWCTGCDLCVAPCPVDCISMPEVTPGKTGWAAWSQEQAAAARERHASRTVRLERERQEKEARLAARAAARSQAGARRDPAEEAAQARKHAILQAARERARQQREKAAASGKLPSPTASPQPDDFPDNAGGKPSGTTGMPASTSTFSDHER